MIDRVISFKKTIKIKNLKKKLNNLKKFSFETSKLRFGIYLEDKSAYEPYKINLHFKILDVKKKNI